MRASLIALLFLPVLASAQPVAGSSYISPGVGFGYSSSGGGAFSAGALVGYQLTDHLDVGVAAYGGDATLAGVTPFVTLQPQLGVRTPLGAGFEAEARVAVSVMASDIGPNAFGLRALGTQADVRLSREIPVVGSLKLAPTVGGYATACTTFNVDVREGQGCAEAGALLGAEIRFRAFGMDAAIPLVLPVRLVGDSDRANLGVYGTPLTPARAGIRITF